MCIYVHSKYMHIDIGTHKKWIKPPKYDILYVNRNHATMKTGKQAFVCFVLKTRSHYIAHVALECKAQTGTELWSSSVGLSSARISGTSGLGDITFLISPPERLSFNQECDCHVEVAISYSCPTGYC